VPTPPAHDLLPQQHPAALAGWHTCSTCLLLYLLLLLLLLLQVKHHDTG
jgi:hypothetical protein